MSEGNTKYFVFLNKNVLSHIVELLAWHFSRLFKIHVLFWMPPFLVTPPFILLIKPFCCYICHRCFTLSLPGALKNGEEISYYLFGRRGYTRGGILACLWSQLGSYPSPDTAAPATLSAAAGKCDFLLHQKAPLYSSFFLKEVKDL